MQNRLNKVMNIHPESAAAKAFVMDHPSAYEISVDNTRR